MTKQEVQHVVDLAYALYPHIMITDEVYEAAYLALYQYHLGEVQTALTQCLQKPGRTGPVRPDELVELIDREHIRQAAYEHQETDVHPATVYGMEEYSLPDGTGKMRRYIRCSKESRKQWEDIQVKAGLHKIIVRLANGRSGSYWAR
jgi:hypothetical protein